MPINSHSNLSKPIAINKYNNNNSKKLNWLNIFKYVDII